MTAQLEPCAPEDQPPVSVELDALTLIVEAYIQAEGPKKGRRLLQAAADILARREENERTIVDLLAPRESASRAKMRRQVRAWFRGGLPKWIAKLDGM